LFAGQGTAFKKDAFKPKIVISSGDLPETRNGLNENRSALMACEIYPEV